MFQFASPHLHYPEDEDDFKESKIPSANTINDKKHRQVVEEKRKRPRMIQKKLHNKLYKGLKHEKFPKKQVKTAANAVTYRIHFWKMFQVASHHLHHIQDKNNFKESENPAAKISNDKKMRQFAKKN